MDASVIDTAKAAPLDAPLDEARFSIAARSLNHWFGAGEAKYHAIRDVNLEIERGKLTILMGPSGSGKTTLLTLLGCLRDVQDGSVRVLGSELNGLAKTPQEIMRQRLGFIFQAHNLHPSLTARQNVMLGLQVKELGDDPFQRTAAAHALGLVGLADRVDYLPDNLSGGQKQRVAIARALAGNPDIVFADEPTAALDRDAGVRIVEILCALGAQRGTTTVMVTHDNRILDMADRIVTLEEGRLVDDSAPPS
ncbi:MAG: ATP-binding cassette domain-containing protein [Devosiaceae bacterium]|nr:ATP-binding cassette domain-containing protein [Devosiaceae bacterium MH13]